VSESRAAVLHCPFCADEDLHPVEHERAAHGAWECRSCLRVFTVNLLGLSARVAGGSR
jgi:ribosomal protein L37AE/L43A